MKTDPAAAEKSKENSDLRPEVAARTKFVGAKGILEFDLETSALEFQNACKAESWREVVETMEYRLAELECTPTFKPQRQVVTMLLQELRNACYSNGVSTELMEEDRKDQHDDQAHGSGSARPNG